MGEIRRVAELRCGRGRRMILQGKDEDEERVEKG
jgi:hypothetical protein